MGRQGQKKTQAYGVEFKRAARWGSSGRRIKSSRPDQIFP
jgi:hypothetical protein